MKKQWSVRGLWGVCLVSMLALPMAGSRLAAQEEGQGVYITQASARLTKLVDVGNKKGYGFLLDGFSIGGGWLKQSQTKWVGLYTVELMAGKEYVFLAAGDNDAKDIDLQVTNAAGAQVALDDKTDPEAVVVFRPEASGRYAVNVRLYDSKDNQDCVCLSVVMVKK